MSYLKIIVTFHNPFIVKRYLLLLITKSKLKQIKHFFHLLQQTQYIKFLEVRYMYFVNAIYCFLLIRIQSGIADQTVLLEPANSRAWGSLLIQKHSIPSQVRSLL